MKDSSRKIINAQNTFMNVATASKSRARHIENLIKHDVPKQKALSTDFGLLGVPHQKIMIAIVGRVNELHRRLLDSPDHNQEQFNFLEAREFNLDSLQPDYTSADALIFDACFESEEEELRSAGKLYSWSYTGIKKYLQSRRNSLDDISKSIRELSEWPLEWGYREKGATYNATSSFIYEFHEPEKGSSKFKFRLHAALEKMAILNKNFTCISVDRLKQFDRSSASLALYRVCSRYAHNCAGDKSTTPWYTPEEWKDLLFIPQNKYPNISLLKEKVFDRCSTIINGRGELHISYEAEKEGRKVKRVRFHIIRKISILGLQPAVERTALNDSQAQEALAIYSELINLNVDSPWIKKWIYNPEDKTSGPYFNTLGFQELNQLCGLLTVTGQEKFIHGGYCVRTIQQKYEEKRALNKSNGTSAPDNVIPFQSRQEADIHPHDEDSMSKYCEGNNALKIYLDLKNLQVPEAWLMKWIYHPTEDTHGAYYSVLGYEDLVIICGTLKLTAATKPINGNYCITTLKQKYEAKISAARGVNKYQDRPRTSRELTLEDELSDRSWAYAADHEQGGATHGDM